MANEHDGFYGVGNGWFEEEKGESVNGKNRIYHQNLEIL